ncbi:MAG TPA: cytochrome c biogenesis protein CcsA [Gammaproteobacteria bacterium]
MEREQLILWLAVIAYVVAGVVAIFAVVLGKKPERTILGMMVLGLVLHGAAILLRWERLDHGPYLTMFEILSSNIWSLMFFFVLAYWRYRPIRATAAVVLPLLFIMMGWMMLSHPGEGHLPPTYDTTWLVIHIMFGKVFLGATLVAVGMAGVILLRRYDIATQKFARLPDDRRLDDLAYRFMALGLIFDTLMLIAGAIWAQDAWGRYWAWDPLETWSFITWLTLGFALHLRITFKPAPARGAVMIMAVFVLAFLTFFGIPFISKVPHQGAV